MREGRCGGDEAPEGGLVNLRAEAEGELLSNGGVCKQLGLTKEPRAAFTSEPALSHHWARWFNTNKLRNKGFAFEWLVDTDGVSMCVHYTRPLPPPPAPPPAASSSSTSSRPSAAAAAAHAVGLPHIGRGIAEMREFVFDPDTQIGVGIDPGVTQAVSAASVVWDPATGQLKADQLRRAVASTDQAPPPAPGALPAKGKEYPGLGYKRVRDKPPKAQEQQQQPAVAQ
ncbi:hypothetical protein QJQ45_001446 [Haematococcus lacustris]|nr:hypothetical protein QJQ45_001446 [Haematococcus lacustris]